MTREDGVDGHLWLHQAEALGALNRGEYVMVATATASGKSMVFQTWTLHGIKSSPEPTTLVFYPTKALANDQERRWLEACELVGLPRETIGKINGDVRVNQRDPIISRARVVIMTPDVCHAWLTRRADSQAVRHFLTRLRNVIIDFRRLAIAAVNAGNARAAPVRRRHCHHPQPRGAHAEADRAGVRGGEREQERLAAASVQRQLLLPVPSIILAGSP